MPESRKTIAVVGAGPAGLTAAYELTKCGCAVDVFEASGRIGGMSASLSLWGQTVDCGPHRFFSTDRAVNAVWSEVIGTEYDLIDRLTRIHYRNRYFDYPLKPLNALSGLGPLQSARCMASYAASRLFPRKDESSFEDWVSNRFGVRLYEIFFKTYSEKLWGISCRDLDADFAAQRIRKLSLFEAVKAALFGGGGTRHKTLVDQFAYPRGGTGAFYAAMARRIADNGGRIHLRTPVRAVTPVEGGAELVLQDSSVRRFDHVVSTMPLTDLVAGLDPPRDILELTRLLRYRNTILVYLEIEGTGLFPDQWIYVHSPDLATGRITNFRNWSPSLHGDSPNTIVCMEYWCYDTDPIWTESDARIVARAGTELTDTGLVGSSRILQGHVLRIGKSYPVYSRNYRQALRPIEEFLDTVPCVTPIGRYGAFKYNNQDHSILMGILAARKIMGVADHDLWRVNTDYEYQEAATIATTGLDKPATVQGRI